MPNQQSRPDAQSVAHPGRNMPLAAALLALALLVTAGLACALPPLGPEELSPEELQTAVGATLTALVGTEAPAAQTQPPAPAATATSTAAPTATLTPSPTPPPGGKSFNCDGTYQRVRIVDGGAAGKTVFVDRWLGGSWVEAWRLEGGDPMIRQIEAEAGVYPVETCRSVLFVPLRYSGSGAVLELLGYAWDGNTMVEVYRQDGTHGDWEISGPTVRIMRSVYLYGEPNCCPCNRETVEHTWDGSAFVQTSSVIEPTYEGEAPEYCQP